MDQECNRECTTPDASTASISTWWLTPEPPTAPSPPTRTDVPTIRRFQRNYESPWVMKLAPRLVRSERCRVPRPKRRERSDPRLPSEGYEAQARGGKGCKLRPGQKRDREQHCTEVIQKTVALALSGICDSRIKKFHASLAPAHARSHRRMSVIEHRDNLDSHGAVLSAKCSSSGLCSTEEMRIDRQIWRCSRHALGPRFQDVTEDPLRFYATPITFGTSRNGFRASACVERGITCLTNCLTMVMTHAKHNHDGCSYNTYGKNSSESRPSCMRTRYCAVPPSPIVSIQTSPLMLVSYAQTAWRSNVQLCSVCVIKPTRVRVVACIKLRIRCKSRYCLARSP